jgi:hypothetical protein
VAGLVDRALRAGVRRGLRRGLVEGDRLWLAVGAVALGVRVVQRLASPGKPIVVTERLEPGQTLIVRHLLPGE